MLKKRKAKKRNSDYKPVFTDAEHKLMLDYGVGDLMDEVGVNRIMIYRALDKMNQEMENLSFRDHLDALRAVAYTTRHIAGLLDIRERLYKPYQEVEKQYREYFDKSEELADKIGIALYGQEKWEDVKREGLRKSMGLSKMELDAERSETEGENGL